MNANKITIEQAKERLELCRANSKDIEDPFFKEAVDLMETQPELRIWFDEMQAIDSEIADSFQAIKAPSDLEFTILRNQEESALKLDDAARSHPTKISQVHPSKKRQILPFIGIAAAVVLALGLARAFTIWQQPAQLADQDLPSVLNFLSDELGSVAPWDFDKKDKDLAALKDHLAETKAPVPSFIPSYFDQLEGIGCLTLDYSEDTQLSVICFEGSTVYHYVTADLEAYPDPIPLTPTTYQSESKAFQIWVEGGQVNIVSAKGPREVFGSTLFASGASRFR